MNIEQEFDLPLELYPLDPEIERTFHRRRRHRRVLAGVANMEDNEVADPGAAAPLNGQGNHGIPLMDDRDRAIREYAVPILQGLNPGIVRPEI